MSFACCSWSSLLTYRSRRSATSIYSASSPGRCWHGTSVNGSPSSRAGGRQPIRQWIAPAVVSGLVTLWAVGVVTDRYYLLMGDVVRFGLRERPVTFGHNAARFAGRQGLPTRALVFDLGQTGVYIYHNGPERKVFMDARLELPSLSTFQTYVRIEEWLNHSDPRWDAAIARLGDPLVLISHDGWAEAEAALLTHPRWRCVYFDAIASVFVCPRRPLFGTLVCRSRLHGGAFRRRAKCIRFGGHEKCSGRGDGTPATGPSRQKARRRHLANSHPHIDARFRSDPGVPRSRNG